jgi:predicted nucleic acid-binding protein
MIILDTNVLSELMKPAPASMVIDWIAAQPVVSLYTTSRPARWATSTAAG